MAIQAYAAAMAVAPAGYRAESGLALQLASLLLELGRQKDSSTDETGAKEYWTMAASVIAHADQESQNTLPTYVYIHMALRQHTPALTAFMKLLGLAQRNNEEHGAGAVAISTKMLQSMLPVLLDGGHCEDAIRVSKLLASQCPRAAANADSTAGECQWEVAVVEPICAGMVKGDWDDAVTRLQSIEKMQV